MYPLKGKRKETELSGGCYAGSVGVGGEKDLKFLIIDFYASRHNLSRENWDASKNSFFSHSQQF